MKTYIKIIFSLLSIINIYIITNCSNKTIHDDNTIINYFIHNKGEVCPFGVLCGKIMLLFGLIQIIFLIKKKYYIIKYINIIFLILGILFSFMNFYVLINIIPSFILQLLIILI